MHRIQSLAFDYNGYQLAIEQHGERGEAIIPVSYTHLTLPTIYSV